MRLELEMGLELFFSKKLKQTITCPLPVFSAMLLYFRRSKNIRNAPLLSMLKEWL
jgi:hypothetical protein